MEYPEAQRLITDQKIIGGKETTNGAELTLMKKKNEMVQDSWMSKVFQILAHKGVCHCKRQRLHISKRTNG